MTDLDKFLKEAKLLGKKKAANSPKASVKLPDAIVLVETRLRCKGCGTKYNYPNLHLLMRNDRQRSRIKEWLMSYNSLPREHFIIQEVADACIKCFLGDGCEEIQTKETPTLSEQRTGDTRIFPAVS